MKRPFKEFAADIFERLAILIKAIFIFLIIFALGAALIHEINASSDNSVAISNVSNSESLLFTRYEMEPKFGGSLDIFLSREIYDATPYLEKDKYISSIGAKWCSGIKSSLFFPHVNFRDFYSGDKFDTYYCNPKGNMILGFLN